MPARSFKVPKRTVLASASNLFPFTVTVLRNGLDIRFVSSCSSAVVGLN
jgi:hypothetical protein